MQSFYADGKPAADDFQRTKAIELGHVPKGCCFLGGGVIAVEVAYGRDPCGVCPGDRAICGGRPQVLLGAATGRVVSALRDAQLAHTDLRRVQMLTLDRLCRGEE